MGKFTEARREVAATVDFHRIYNIPRRRHTAEEKEYIRRELTAALKTPQGKGELRIAQAYALHEMGIANGLVGIMRVGSGKTITSLLAPLMFDPEPKRPLLILPAAHIEKIRFDVMKYSKDWRIPKSLQTASYESLGRVDGANFLDMTLVPDLIILDEAHKVKNPKAAVTRRLIRYMKEHPKTRVVVLTGTLYKASLRDAAHLIRWALKDNAPVPLHDNEVDSWADAIDDDNRVNGIKRQSPGALVSLYRPSDFTEEQRATHTSQVKRARLGFRMRMEDTCGVVSTAGEQVDCSLNITGIKYDVNPATEKNFEKLRTEWATPDDWQLTQAMEVWRVARELAMGMHYVWDPRPPEEWRVRRKLWHQFVRDVLKKSRHLDSEAQVAEACREGALERSAFDAWDKIRPSFKPTSKAVWHDDSVLRICQEWAEKHAGIIWVEHAFFGEELSRRTGMPFFGEGGFDLQGNALTPIADEVLERTRKPFPLIASIHAIKTGFNLQGWDRNLITSCPTSAADWEQLLGRTHRDGQRSDEVNVDLLIGCWEHADAWSKACDLAKTTEQIDGSSQKLCISTPVMPGVDFLQGARWQKTLDENDDG